MIDNNDFKIVNGILEEYHGPGGEVVIPEGVVGITSGFLKSIFAECKSVRKIVVPSGVKTLNYRVFCRCADLEEVILPDDLSCIAEEAFLGCVSLQSIVIPEKVEQIGPRAFYGCTELKKITILGAHTSIPKSSFELCPSAFFYLPYRFPNA